MNETIKEKYCYNFNELCEEDINKYTINRYNNVSLWYFLNTNKFR